MRVTEEEYNRLIKRNAAIKPISETVRAEIAPKSKGGKANKTETEYSNMLRCEFPGAAIVFEGITFKMENGHRYTPDWVVNNGDGQVLCVEVKARGKNGFRHASYQRARLAFDQAKIDYPQFRWRWAEKSQGTWDVKEHSR